MPQPLSIVAPKAGYILASIGSYPFRENEHLARMAMECVASWANVEFNLLRLYVTLAGGHAADAAAVYLSLTGSGPKKGAVATLAERKLTEEQKPVFRAVLKLAGTNEGIRDKLAHHVWGYSPQVPDGLLLADPRDVALAEGGFPSHNRIFVYNEGDFERIIASNDSLTRHVILFDFVLHGHVANSGGALWQKLLEVPEIANILNPPEQGRKTPPAEEK